MQTRRRDTHTRGQGVASRATRDTPRPQRSVPNREIQNASEIKMPRPGAPFALSQEGLGRDLHSKRGDQHTRTHQVVGGLVRDGRQHLILRQHTELRIL